MATEKDRSETMVKVIGGVIVLAIVVGIVGAAVWTRRSQSTAVENAALPAGVLADFGVPYGSAGPDAPLIEVWEDPQCPFCGVLENAIGEHLVSLADAGAIRLIWRPTAFLDDNPNVASANISNGAPDSSRHAIAAWGCAIDQGKTAQFHDQLYARQPQEGAGFPEATLLDIGVAIGLTGAAYEEFAACVQEDRYMGWAQNATLAFRDAGVPGTPTVLLNGSEVPLEQIQDPASVDALLATVATP